MAREVYDTRHMAYHVVAFEELLLQPNHAPELQALGHSILGKKHVQ